MQKKDLFKMIPQVEEILKHSSIEELDYSRSLKTEAIRDVLDEIRGKIIKSNDDEVRKLESQINFDNIIVMVEERIFSFLIKSDKWNWNYSSYKFRKIIT